MGEGRKVDGEGRTSDSPADQRRSMSVNVRGAARTVREVARKRRLKAVARKCIFAIYCTGDSWIDSCSICGLLSVEEKESKG